MRVIRAGNHKNACPNSQQGRLIRLLLQKQSDLALCSLSMPFGRQLVFEILEQLPYSRLPIIYMYMYN